MDVRSSETFGQLLAAVRACLPAGSEAYFLANERRYQGTLQLVERFAEAHEILEIGSSPGHFTALLKAQGYAVVGIDVDPSRIGDFAEKFGLDIRRCDVEHDRLPFPDNRFACVVFMEILEHLRIAICPRRGLPGAAAGRHSDPYDTQLLFRAECCALCTRSRGRGRVDGIP
jgi:SAM-dependent methyltransferase